LSKLSIKWLRSFHRVVPTCLMWSIRKKWTSSTNVLLISSGQMTKCGMKLCREIPKPSRSYRLEASSMMDTGASTGYFQTAWRQIKSAKSRARWRYTRCRMTRLLEKSKSTTSIVLITSSSTESDSLTIKTSPYSRWVKLTNRSWLPKSLAKTKSLWGLLRTSEIRPRATTKTSNSWLRSSSELTF